MPHHTLSFSLSILSFFLSVSYTCSSLCRCGFNSVSPILPTCVPSSRAKLYREKGKIEQYGLHIEIEWVCIEVQTKHRQTGSIYVFIFRYIYILCYLHNARALDFSRLALPPCSMSLPPCPRAMAFTCLVRSTHLMLSCVIVTFQTWPYLFFMVRRRGSEKEKKDNRKMREVER